MKHVANAEVLKAYAVDFVANLRPGTEATLITLSGELGAGKTTFVQGLARALGVMETVSSPTFVIEKIYALTNQAWNRLIHIDAYRLKEARELEVLGWAGIVSDPKNIIVLEWPERVAAIIPPTAHALRLDIDEDARIIRGNGEKDS